MMREKTLNEIKLLFASIFGSEQLCRLIGQIKRDGREKIFYPSPKIILLSCCEHTNLGDQAINVAEISFLTRNASMPVIAISDFASKHLSLLKQLIGKDDIICLHGGGSMGTLYETAEFDRIAVIKNFPNNKIICLPQTVSFEDSPHGKRLLRYLQKGYSTHNNLYIIAREKMSYSRLIKYYPTANILLTPDIVLSHPAIHYSVDREDIALLCVRNDKEKSLQADAYESIASAAQKMYSTVRRTDTVAEEGAGKYLSPGEGKERFYSKVKELATARLVVTDRIHGMIFCALSGTPCIALDNSTGKVGEEYYWLKDLPYIYYASNVEEAVAAIYEWHPAPSVFPAESYVALFSPLSSLFNS